MIYQFRTRGIVDSPIVEVVMRVAELDQYEKDHPELEFVYAASVISDVVRMGLKKPDQSFRELLRHIHKKAGGSKSGQYHWD